MSRQEVGEGRIAPRMARPAGPSAAGRDEGTPRSGARRQPDAGIVKGPGGTRSVHTRC
nr:hypothetical protein [Pantoea sp. 3.5.1]